MSASHRPTGLLYFRGFPRNLKDQFKAWCARRGLTMKQQVELMMLDCVRSDEPGAYDQLKKLRRG